tara:strand:+ start:2973 stop:3836 length:864 start_codon:yes stop_codon:yes gene_type:complete
MIGILGASGYIGQAFVQELIDQNTSFREFSRKKDNYYSLESLINIIHDNGLSVLINCAGYTGKPNVDVCESNKEECYKANVELAKIISTACALTNVTLLHISSGCIYTGDNKGLGFTEEDDPNFHSFSEITGSFYSHTKTIAESIVKSTWEKSYIARLRIPFDGVGGPRNYLTKLQKYEKLLEADNSISHRGDFVKACIHLLKNKADFGIYNIVNTEPVTTSEVAKLLKSEGLLEDYTLLNEEEFYKDVKPKAPRSNCVLNNNKLLDTGFKMRNSKDALIESIRELK